MANNNQIPPFYVGQEVVAVKGHPSGSVIKGQDYIINGIMKGCSCHTWIVTVGEMPTGCKKSGCIKCNFVVDDSTNAWLSSAAFAPKNKFKAISFTKIMEEELTSQN